MPALSFLDRAHSVAPPGYSRWLIPPAALAIHLCIGQAYATSVYKDALVKHFDSSLTAIGVIFSVAIVMLGVSAALFGTWVDRVGPRRTMFTSACCWSAGFLIAAAGIATKQLWLVYFGYGVVGGIGLGLGYISPVSTLIKWFPDRPGLATGMAIMGFGGGAMVAAPLSKQLLSLYGGTEAGGSAVVKLFITLGIAYFVVMMLGVFTVRVPAPGWHPAGFDPATAPSTAMVTSGQVSAANAIKTPQFWLLWVVLLCNVTAGIGILEQAADMIQDFFRGGNGISTVTATVAAGFVGLLSVANMAGRFGWSTTSDYLGRKRTYMVYLGVGILLYLGLSTIGSSSTALFVLFCAVIISFYGGGFATAPAYLRDLFGTFQVGAIHGRLLTAWSTAGVLGPLIVNGVLDAQGTPGDLRAADYRPALLIMTAVLAIGFVANLLIRPVDGKWHEAGAVTDAVDSDVRGAANELVTETSSAGRYRPAIIATWTLVTVPLAYGLFYAGKAALQLFSG
ncbi:MULTISPECIES: OFA family MFS transporter [Tsukamurella]|uniref:OFA family MFS transporter n=1 Tax=Tsukamurella strandjordii TaxID=147577 RepID=A0AA90NT34_9ACTN|nr:MULTISPECIES: OFA family MFS transporter [Tsukamurella]MDP0400354.1 OFA family MFS transporter [Tsukamurella strandjordii]GIZ98405.1 MFS transporter [Tsukamurella sp. TY48]